MAFSLHHENGLYFPPCRRRCLGIVRNMDVFGYRGNHWPSSVTAPSLAILGVGASWPSRLNRRFFYRLAGRLWPKRNHPGFYRLPAFQRLHSLFDNRGGTTPAITGPTSIQISRPANFHHGAY